MAGKRNYFDLVSAVVAWAALMCIAMAPALGQIAGVNNAEPQAPSVSVLAPGPLIFVPPVTYVPGGAETSSIAIADLNGDGKPDLIVTNCGACYGPPSITQGSSVGVLLGNGDGTFQPAVTYSSGGAVPLFAAVADLNHDGKPDVVVVNRNSNGIAVLLGNGDGTLKAAVPYPSGAASPLSVGIADVNGDGKPDLIVANECGDSNCNGSIGVLLGNGDGTFQPAVAYLSGARYAEALTVADVNGDGKPDVLVAHEYFVGVLLGKGDGTFQIARTFSSGGISIVPNSSLIAVADLNGDGKPDIVVEDSQCCGSANGVLGVLLGNGDGTFQPVVVYGSGNGGWGTSFLTNNVAVADVNGDGKPDLVVANMCADNTSDCTFASIGVLLNNMGAPLTSTSLVSSVNPASSKWVVTYTATVIPQAGGGVQGAVTFYDGGATMCMVPVVNNRAACNATLWPKGTHAISAAYLGEFHLWSGSLSNVVEEVIEIQRPTKTVTTTSGSPSMVGQLVTFTTTVTSSYGTIPNGDLVTFYDGATVLGSIALSGGKAVYATSSLSAKSHIIKGRYAGDAGFAPSAGAITQVVEKYPTSTALTSTPNPSAFGQLVTFTATVTPTGPYAVTGSVKFWDGTTGLGTSPLNSGVAKFNKYNLAIGTHTITAQYLGDAYSDKSTSPAVSQVVH